MTSAKVTYVAPTASGLTQSVTRTGPAANISAITLNSQKNYSNVSYTATFTINGPNPSRITVTASSPAGLTLSRVSNVITVNDLRSAGGTTYSNWAALKSVLATLIFTSSMPVWPDPATTVTANITDGTTTLSGIISLSALNATVPTTPVLNVGMNNRVLTWTASTQAIGPGVAGYEIFRDSTVTPIATVTSGLTYTDSTAVPGVTYTYYVRSYDAYAPIYSALSTGVTSLAKEFFSANSTTGYAYVLTSTTPTWNTGTMPSGNKSPTVRANDRYYVTRYEDSSTAFYSTNGTSWSTATLPSTKNWSPVSYGASKYVSIACQGAAGATSNSAAYSSDGVTWTATTLPSTAYWGEAVFGGGKFVVLAGNMRNDGGAMEGTAGAYSTDGVTWTAATVPGTAIWGRPVYSGGKWVSYSKAGTQSGKAIYSTDGINWTAVTLPSIGGFRASDTFSFGVVNNGNIWMIAGRSHVATSSDGITWTAYALPSSRDWYMPAPLLGNNWVITSVTGQIATSSNNGVNWTSAASGGSYPNPVSLGNIVFANKTDGSTGIIQSTDGATWTTVISTASSGTELR